MLTKEKIKQIQKVATWKFTSRMSISDEYATFYNVIGQLQKSLLDNNFNPSRLYVHASCETFIKNACKTGNQIYNVNFTNKEIFGTKIVYTDKISKNEMIMVDSNVLPSKRSTTVLLFK